MRTHEVLSETVEVDPLLRGMELDREKLLAVLDYADAQRALCTSNDVKGFDLITMHDKAARALREQFCGDRWEKDETDNQAGIKNPHLKIRIVPCNFDENAGNPDPSVTPRNRHPKGSASKAKVRCNQTEWLPGLSMPEPTQGEYETWLLGIYADDDGRGAVLSLPLNFSGGKFSQFVTRIVLEQRTDKNATATRKTPDNEPPTEIVDIVVKRK
ncbi:MAG: hypothetical protein IIA72_02035 [Proteobacteria bacterium]|nr:hypothetical protein [Pseudomonadota bacterium]